MFLVLDSRVEIPDMVHKSFALQRTVLYFCSPSLLWVTVPGVRLLVRLCLYLFHSSQCGPLIFVMEVLFIWFSLFFSCRNYSMWSKFLCLWEEGSSGSFYATILDYLQSWSTYQLCLSLGNEEMTWCSYGESKIPRFFIQVKNRCPRLLLRKSFQFKIKGERAQAGPGNIPPKLKG